MASNGGVATASMVSEKPTLTLLSGLAAGVLAGAWIGELAERRKLITFDIGGTSADIGIIVDGRLAETDARSTSIAGFPLLMPMIDIHTIGAGGGSIAYIDHGGAFRVGPRSAGAVPGPAAYGRGGDEPTVTDANLVLGRLDADDFLGGGMKLDAEAARRAVGALASKLGLEPQRGGGGHPHRHQRQHGERHPLAHDPEGHRSARLLAGRLRRRAARCRAPRSPPCSAFPK